jgi:hypothetical protein
MCFKGFMDLDEGFGEVFVEGFDVRFDVGDWANLSIGWGCCWCINYSLKV